MLDKKRYILCSHLLNNYSGSPQVLKEVILTLQAKGYGVRLFLGNRQGEGFLSQLPVDYVSSFYAFKQNKILRLVFLLCSQFDLFFKVLFKVRRGACAVIYCNTLYSFGAALAGRLKGIPMVYHIHETYLSPALLKRFLRAMVRLSSSLNLYVSSYHLAAEEVNGVASKKLYNCINEGLFDEAIRTDYHNSSSFTVLMVCSLKSYKGIDEMLLIARSLPAIRFELVVNANEEEITDFFKNKSISQNVALFPSQTDLTSFYTRAHLVLNLTLPDQVVETFGLTILEAMTFGIPVIAPPVGGPTELVDDGVNGYLISAYETDRLVEQIDILSKDEALCMSLSKAAREKAKLFSPKVFRASLLEVVSAVAP